MVRLKTRWLLVRFDTTTTIQEEQTTTPTVAARQEQQHRHGGTRALLFPTKKELVRTIRDNLIQCFGISSSGAANDTYVRFCDPVTRYILIRVPREFYPIIRASLCFCTEWKDQRIVISVISVHGSARTAKVAIMKVIQNVYRKKLRQFTNPSASYNNTSTSPKRSQGSGAKTQSEIDQLCRALELTIETIENIDF